MHSANILVTKSFVRGSFTGFVMLVWLWCGSASAELSVHHDFPGGSAHVEKIDQQARSIQLLPTQHEQRGWNCWWYFRVDGVVPGDVLTLDVGGGSFATPTQAAVSSDNESWRQTRPGQRSGSRIVYQYEVTPEEAQAGRVWFAWGPPFVPSDAERLVKEAGKKDCAEAFVLCKSEAGRDVPALRIRQGDLPDKDRHAIWIHARQHAWESGSSWVCRGLVEWLVSADPRAESLRRKSLITVVPIMDIDSVADGAGGKNQVPQDHNRDWSEQPHWNSVAAAISEIRRQTEKGNFELFLDLHNPDSGSKQPFFFMSSEKLLSESSQRNRSKFLQVAQLEMTGPLAFKGQTKVTDSSYDKNWTKISGIWVQEHTSPHVVSLCLETAWNTPHSTQEGYQTVGRQLAMAIERYFRK